MKTTNIFFAGVIGGVVDFILGWFFYGGIFSNFFPEGEDMDLTFIALGCITFGLIMAYIYENRGGITTFMSGAKAGIGLGILFGFWTIFFSAAQKGISFDTFAVELFIHVATTILVGGVVGFILGKLQRKRKGKN